MRRRSLLLLTAVACGGGDGSGSPDAAVGWSAAPALPAPVSNNAVAAVTGDAGCTVYSALGIGSALTADAIGTAAYAWHEGDASWTTMADVPGATGRVAAAAVGLRGRLYLLGGYSVGAGGQEVSFDSVDIYDPASGWSSGPPMPVAVDDQVALAWRDRWIVVVSGWSNTGNVRAVQIYDADTEGWSMASDFPGTPAFGHAGALTGDTLAIVDGAASSAGFPLVNQVWRGDLDPGDPTTIQWTDLGSHPGPARYRAAGGAGPAGQLWFHGGTDDPYNYDGRSYDSGQPSAPLASTLVYEPGSGQLGLVAPDKPRATMDHRALARCPSALYAAGGMVAGPQVTGDVWRFSL